MYKSKHNKRETGTEFEKQWGIHIDDLARAEDLTPDAIRMRIHKWGNPFQRRSKMSIYETKYGKTQSQIALELGLHPISIADREKKFKDVYHPVNNTGRWNTGRVTNDAGTHWTNTSSWQFNLKNTFFTLEEALEKLEQITQAQHETNKDMGNGV